MKTLKRHNVLLASGRPIQNRLCIAVPMTGLLRAEWVLARYGQMIPCNWSAGETIGVIDTFAPLGYAVDNARNASVAFAVRERFEWLLFIDHDVILPRDTFVKMNEYMADDKLAVVAGLYSTKSVPPEPLIYRGRGNSWFRNWKPGDKVWVDGVPMGCTLISMRLLKPMYEASEPYTLGKEQVRRVFVTPRATQWLPEIGVYMMRTGTEDLAWCDRVLSEGWLAKTGYKHLARKEWPFLCDTSIRCGHIDQAGQVY